MTDNFGYVLASFLSGLITGCVLLAVIAGDRDETRVKLGLMTTDKGVYRLVEVKP